MTNNISFPTSFSQNALLMNAVSTKLNEIQDKFTEELEKPYHEQLSLQDQIIKIRQTIGSGIDLLANTDEPSKLKLKGILIELKKPENTISNLAQLWAKAFNKTNDNATALMGGPDKLINKNFLQVKKELDDLGKTGLTPKEKELFEVISSRFQILNKAVAEMKAALALTQKDFAAEIPRVMKEAYSMQINSLKV